MSRREDGRFGADDLLSFQLISDFDLSPDGRQIIYARQRIDPDADAYVSNLWLISTAGGVPRQLTFGDDADLSPRFSPDGARVAFLSDRGGGPAQLYALRVDGGEAKRLTDLKAGAGPAVWSPDGSSIAFAAAIAPEAPPDGRRLAFYGSSEEGDSREQLWIVDADGGGERRVGSEDAEIASFPLGRSAPPAWSADGSELAVVLATASLSEVALVSADGGGVRKAVCDDRQITQLAAAPRAGLLAFAWSDFRLCGQLGASRWDGSEQARLLNANDEWAKGRAWPEVKLREFRGEREAIESHFGTSDSGYYIDPFDMRGEPFEVRERYHALSPVRCAGAAETPTLLLQGEDDQRCPVGQAEELFAALVRAGKAKVEFVRYPGGTHHLAERGKPSHRVDYNRRIVAWLEAHCAERGGGG
ncbi:MAG TPA: prolyl oligopeptidase family serine peptidase [Polyangiaceae bacterium]|nr:prolyl oligopeptidase family serine peptidase [Polyangiaceae bacterium]